ncbi:Der1-like family [Novymonas esmeraldas]|uniref:Derlin n=1 Tax=Novymonas esmeraldas TaxID=1808958 RepID=A0AAW0F7S0_9TRYP
MNHIFENILRETPVTTVVCGLMGIFGVLSSLGVIHPLYLALIPSMVFKEHQYWRLLTNFFYVGPISAHCIMEIQWIYLISSRLEAQYYHRRATDYVFLLFVIGCSLLGLRFTSVVDVPYLSYVLGTCMTYIMSRLFNDMQVAIFFVIPVPMRLLPFVFMIMNTMVSGITNEVFGNLLGHILWYLLEVLPRITGCSPLRIQWFFERAFAAAGRQVT